MTTIPTARRPVLITVLVVLVVLGGIGAALTAVLLLTMQNSAVWPGLLQVVIALAYFAVAKGLLDGNPTARIVAAAVSVVQIVLAVVTIVGTSTDNTRVSSAWGTLVFAVLVLVVLYTPRANAFFGSRR